MVLHFKFLRLELLLVWLVHLSSIFPRKIVVTHHTVRTSFRGTSTKSSSRPARVKVKTTTQVKKGATTTFFLDPTVNREEDPIEWRDDDDTLFLGGRDSLKIKGPTVFIIGAPEAGAASLFNLLVRHPQICPSRKGAREIHFFDVDNNYDLGSEYYDSLFQNCSKENFHYVDYTPTYLFHEKVPRRMNETIFESAIIEKKIIAILREPVAREFAVYQRYLDQCIESIEVSIEDHAADSWEVSTLCASTSCKILHCDEKSHITDGNILHLGLATFEELHWNAYYAGFSFYNLYLENYLKVFNRTQLLIIGHDALVGETSTVMNRISLFLGLDHDWGSPALLKTDTFSTANITMDCKTRDSLREIYSEPNRRLLEMLQRDGAHPAQPFFKPFQDPASYPCYESTQQNIAPIHLPDLTENRRQRS